jgi:predicted negative regulator of RcsB-dependent stress response
LETPEQELEALKNWWKENGLTLVVGITIGLGGVFGWNWWQDHLRSQAEEASLIYRQLTDNAAAEKHDLVREQATEIVRNYPKTGYAALASLLAAKSAFSENDSEAAKRRLEWVIENGESPSFKDMARLRLARILIDEDMLDEAMATVESVEQQAFSASANEVRGDIQMARGNTEGAREAYIQALANGAISGPTRSRVQMKLDDLAGGPADNVPG